VLGILLTDRSTLRVVEATRVGRWRDEALDLLVADVDGPRRSFAFARSVPRAEQDVGLRARPVTSPPPPPPPTPLPLTEKASTAITTQGGPLNSLSPTPKASPFLYEVSGGSTCGRSGSSIGQPGMFTEISPDLAHRPLYQWIVTRVDGDVGAELCGR